MRQQYLSIIKKFSQSSPLFCFPKKILKDVVNLEISIKDNFLKGKSALMCDKYVRSILIKKININIFDDQILFNGECCPEEFRRIFLLLKQKNTSNLVAAGGGKVLDMAKYLKKEIPGLNLINIPTSAATCAAFTPVSVIYDREGCYLNTIDTTPPDVLIIFYDFFMELPFVFFAAGAMDTLSKFYETNIFYKYEREKNFFDKYTRDLSFILKKNIFKILKKDKDYIKDSDKKFLTDCNIIYSGLISCVGIKTVTSSIAHALAHAMTIIPKARKYLHGEHIAVALLIQERFLENKKNVNDIKAIINKIDMPVELSQIDVYEGDIDLLYKRYINIKQNEKIYVPVSDDLMYNILEKSL